MWACVCTKDDDGAWNIYTYIYIYIYIMAKWWLVNWLTFHIYIYIYCYFLLMPLRHCDFYYYHLPIYIYIYIHSFIHSWIIWLIVNTHSFIIIFIFIFLNSQINKFLLFIIWIMGGPSPYIFFTYLYAYKYIGKKISNLISYKDNTYDHSLYRDNIIDKLYTEQILLWYCDNCSLCTIFVFYATSIYITIIFEL